MKILHTSFECYPIAKVGGLADVVGALPKYQNNLGYQSIVAMPFYENEYTDSHELETIHSGKLTIDKDIFEFSVRKLIADLIFEIYTIHIPGLLDRKNVYGYQDDTKRSIAFQMAVLDWISDVENRPDIIHCHDHHTGLIPFLVSHGNAYQVLRDIPTVFTIHNAQYQGQISYDKIQSIPAFDQDKIGLLDWNNCINPLAAAIKCAWKVTTVSPNYMKELQVKANGLEDLLKQEKSKCTGVLNGIDVQTWNPETDPMLVKNYKFSTVVSGRKANKKWLCDHYGLDMSKPLFSFIGRLVGEKGADLLPEIITDTLQNIEANILILGSGNQETEKQLLALKDTFPGKYNTHIGYNEKLSHIVYAGTDFLLMPSRVEPCGLNQMYALRYGAIPIVRRTGGLKDTIIDVGDGGFGFCMDQSLVWDVCYAIKRAVTLYEDETAYRKTQRYIMKIDHSWDRSAQQYIDLYQSLIFI